MLYCRACLEAKITVNANVLPELGVELLLSANPKGLHPQDGWLLSFLECSSGRPMNFHMGPHQFPLPFFACLVPLFTLSGAPLPT